MPPRPASENNVLGRFDENNVLEIDDFFRRNGFYPSMKLICDMLAKSRFPAAVVKPAPCQGYCSYTVTINNSYLLQFRPVNFKLDMRICHQARILYPSLAPATAYLGSFAGGDVGKACESEKASARLYLYIQKRIPGIRLSEFRTRGGGGVTLQETRTQRRGLVEDLADVVAESYQHRQYPCRANKQVLFKSKIGKSLKHRLDLLKDIESPAARLWVDRIQQRLDAIEDDMPWCLTHGDLIPSNIMVDRATGRFTGLVDWTEGEWLPFGVGLYGLEEVLGEEHDGNFFFYPEHEELRMLFWKRFLSKTDESLETLLSGQWWEMLRLCRQLGVLLWRGIAWDEGRLDRVVDAEKDQLDFQKMEKFLQSIGPFEKWKQWRRQLLVVQSWLPAHGLRDACLGLSASHLHGDDEDGCPKTSGGRHVK